MMAIAFLGEAGADGVFDRVPGLERRANRYEVPNFEGVEWKPMLATEAGLVGAGATSTFLAVAANFPDRKDLLHYVRAMALVMAHQLNPEDQAIRVANHQLRYRRAPETVARWTDRSKLAARLWEIGWTAHKTEAEHSSAALLVLDLAAAFDDSDESSMARYRDLSKGQMELRWAGALRLPEGIDAPDYIDEVVYTALDRQEETPGEAGDEEIVPEEPAEFAFATDEASVLVPAAPHSGQRFVRLNAKVFHLNQDQINKRKRAASRAKKDKADNKDKKDGEDIYRDSLPLPVGFFVGRHNGAQAPLIIADLERARGEFLRRYSGKEIPEDLGVEFSIADGALPAGGGLLSCAAGLVLESMVSGVKLRPGAAAAGMVSSGSGLQPSSGLGSALMGAAGDFPGNANDYCLAVPASSAPAVVDLAAFGEYGLLMELQIIGCRDLGGAVRVLTGPPESDTAKAIALFGDITRAARRSTPAQLLANAKVTARLRQVVSLCPGHLSALELLRASSGRAQTASLQGSIERLGLLERDVRSHLLTHLAEEGAANASGGTDELCASTLNSLRHLRPRIHSDARPYADGLASLVEDFRVALRSQSRSRTSRLAMQRAESLRTSLETLEHEVAALDIGRP